MSDSPSRRRHKRIAEIAKREGVTEEQAHAATFFAEPEPQMCLRATARDLGISHVALLKAESEGVVPKRKDGLFDVVACRIKLARQ